MAKEQPLWKVTAQGALIGLVGAAAMFATEMLLFPGLAHAEVTVDAPAIVIVSSTFSALP